MATIDNPNYASGTWGRDQVAEFSPDGKYFTVILKSGNLESNTVDYRLLLFQTERATSSFPPEVLTSLSSSSTRPAIESVSWLDNNTVAFLGENPGDLHQLFIVDRVSKRLHQITTHPTNLVAYSFNSRTKSFFFTAYRSTETTVGARNYIIVDRDDLTELILGKRQSLLQGLDLFVVGQENDRPRLLTVSGKLEGLSTPWPSPNGRYLAIQTITTRRDIPDDWYTYDTVSQQTILSKQGASTVNEYQLIDLMTGKSRPVIDAPLGAWYSNLAWSSDSRAVVISGTNLPLDVPDPTERRRRMANLFVAEVEISDHTILPITEKDALIRSWDSQANELVLQLTNRHSYSSFEEGTVVVFEKTDQGWRLKQSAEEHPANRIRVSVEEDMNTAPRLVVSGPSDPKPTEVLDPNPGFARLNFGRVEEIQFRTGHGHQVKAGVYRPPGYRVGKRYPLVIQTHGWAADRFWMDGPDPNAMAAQPLASKGFVVVQVGDEVPTAIGTPSEAKVATAEFEWVIDALSKKGLIDPTRIGIVGFSATGPGVAYAVAHSRYRFRAAVLAETNDAGYFTYLSTFNIPGARERFEAINGGPPFGRGLFSWIKEAPEFSLDKVDTAMLLESNEAWSLLSFWEWFVGFRRLGKPVELVFMPDAGHVVTKPSDRMISQGTAADWFDFWLKEEEDPDPAKAAQYKRWRELRKLQEANEKTTAAIQ